MSGYLKVGPRPEETYWGLYPYRGEEVIATIICNKTYHIIVPNPPITAENPQYIVPGYLHNSKELVVEIPNSPYDGDKVEELQIWHSEDFFGKVNREWDNSGKICVNVYANFV